jgi:endonuclease-8
MPEGPTLVILCEEAQPFVGKVVRKAEGNVRTFSPASLEGKKVLALKSWGKHFLIVFKDGALRIHFLLFGSYRINQRKPNANPRLSLGFAKGQELNFYASAIKPVSLDDYDWRGDVMSDAWDPALARKKLRARPDLLACDALLDQDIFAGVGNIIKNEVLFRIRLHPLTRIGALPARKLSQLVEQARTYSFDFLEWKKLFVLKQHWLAHRKSTCPRCHIPYSKGILGQAKRRAFWCEQCQIRYE